MRKREWQLIFFQFWKEISDNKPENSYLIFLFDQLRYFLELLLKSLLLTIINIYYILLIVSLHFINIQDYVYEFIQYFLK